MDHHELLADEMAESEYPRQVRIIYAVISLVIVSLCGLLGLLVLPLMQRFRKVYDILIQFLIALAVGAMSGDALLHLLPHALDTSHSHGHHEDGHLDEHDGDHVEGEHHDGTEDMAHHNEEATGMSPAVAYGLAAMLAIFIFFVLQKITTLVGNLMANRMMDQSTEVGSIRDGNVVKTAASEPFPDANEQPGGQNELYIRHHETLHLGHNHCHSHVTSRPRSISSVAYIVLLGDGLHNFADGMAIGAAFTTSPNLAVGVSTSVAVLFHELPQELGEFALLLNSGMTIWQAVVYNSLSSLTAFIGLAIGILIGEESEQLSVWVLAVTAGTFLYIALADLVPELNSCHSSFKSDEKSDLRVERVNVQLWLLEVSAQLAGFAVGTICMLVLALTEA